MSYAEIGLTVGGVLSLALAIFHCTFYRYFDWAHEFRKISRLNSAVLYTIHLFLIFLFLFFAYISFVYQDELVSTEGLARSIIVFYALFWLFRAIWQVVYFSPKKIAITPATKIIRPIMVLWFLLLSAAYFTPIAFPVS